MRKILKTIALNSILLLILSVITLGVTAETDEIVVIVNKENTNSIDKELIIQIYTGATKGWPDGTPVFALDQASKSVQRQLFYQHVIGKSKVTMRAIWAQNIFSGRGLPPKLATPDVQMKNLVSSNKNAIGYIRASNVDSNVKVITH